jgi:hypothetical protein
MLNHRHSKKTMRKKKKKYCCSLFVSLEKLVGKKVLLIYSQEFVVSSYVFRELHIVFRTTEYRRRQIKTKQFYASHRVKERERKGESDINVSC